MQVVKDKNDKVLSGKKEMERTFPRVIQSQDCDRFICTQLPVEGRNEHLVAGFTREEGEAAIHRLKRNKGMCVVSIMAKEIQAAGNSGVEILLKLCER